MSSQKTQTDGRTLNWVNTIFLTMAHLIAGFTIVWALLGNTSWQSWVLAWGYLIICGFAITAGYHRFFAHRSYKASWPWKLLMLLFGAASVQNSAIAWSRDHRRHHKLTDSEDDPYNIQKGFWWAHIGWVLFKDKSKQQAKVTDLENDALVAWQHKHYLTIAIVMCVALPLLLGSLWGDPVGALLLVGFFRLVVQWHITFTINSLAHMVGTRPYSKKNSARDSWLIGLVSWGEGYHNFHHRFPSDYRNGVRWWQLDATKWLLWTLSKIGLTKDLRRTSRATIEKALNSS